VMKEKDKERVCPAVINSKEASNCLCNLRKESK